MSALEGRVHAWVQRRAPTLLADLRALVAVNTENHAPFGQENPAQHLYAEALRAQGCELDVYEVATVPGLLAHPAYWAERPCTGRRNVLARRRGRGGGRSLLLSGHMDTVPAEPELWSRPPWAGEIAGGQLWGLGAYDMKAGLAAALGAARALHELALPLRGDLLIESVVDEEYGGCNGTLAARLRANADLAILAEPTQLDVCPAHHGGLMVRASFRGRPGWAFSPDPPGDPTLAMAHWIVALRRWADGRVARASRSPSGIPAAYRDDPALPTLINQVKAGAVDLPFFADRVPGEAWLTVWIQTYPGQTQDEIQQELWALTQEAKASQPALTEAEVTLMPLRWLDGSAVGSDHAGVELLQQLVTRVHGPGTRVRGAPFACDAHIFNLHSPTPVVMLGPAGGNPHAPDEYVDTASYLQLTEIFTLAALHWCGVATDGQAPRPA